MTQVPPSVLPVVLLEQMGALAEHPVSLGQDAATSIFLHLGKVEAEVYLAVPPYRFGTLTGCVPGTIKTHTLSVLLQSSAPILFLPRPACANLKKTVNINLFHCICLTSPAAEEI